MAGLPPPIHPLRTSLLEDRWIRGSSPRMTQICSIREQTAADAVLDHPGSQQPVARRAAVSAVLGIFADLRVDAGGQPDAWRVFHARHLFCGRSDAFVRR